MVRARGDGGLRALPDRFHQLLVPRELDYRTGNWLTSRGFRLEPWCPDLHVRAKRSALRWTANWQPPGCRYRQTLIHECCDPPPWHSEYFEWRRGLLDRCPIRPTISVTSSRTNTSTIRTH